MKASVARNIDAPFKEVDKIIDLLAAKARYYGDCFKTILYIYNEICRIGNPQGCPLCNDVSHKMQIIYDNLNENYKSQLCVEELRALFGTQAIYPYIWMNKLSFYLYLDIHL